MPDNVQPLKIDASAEALRRAEVLMPGGVSSPVRAFQAVGGRPLFIASAAGSHLTDIDGTEERLYDLQKDPTQHVDISEENSDLCKSLNERIWKKADGDIPRYEIVRKGHDWYEYPDIYDPTTSVAKRLRERYA